MPCFVRNETEKREFFAVSSCVQLSPATKEAEWTIFRENMPLRREHVSMVTPEGLLLMGGYNSRSVDLLKPDGSLQKGIYKLERTIEYAAALCHSHFLTFYFQPRLWNRG